jgi:predicted DNA-binding protein YlxM (UPF0122 family)
MADRLTDKKKKEIIAYYVECQNYSETGRKFKVSEGTVRNVVKKDQNITKKCEQKNEENTKSVLEAMEERKDKKINLLNKILDAMEKKVDNVDMFTSIRDLAMAYGTIMDKEIKIKELDVRGKDNKDALEKLDALLEAQKNA